MDKEILANILSEYHRMKGRYNFLYAGEERANLIRGLVGKKKYVLDLGCRDGTLTKYFMEENRVIGLDIDREALSICRDKFGIATIWHDVNEGLPFENHSFDLVVAAEFLEHIYYPPILVKEIRRILKKNGYFVGSTTNPLYIKDRLKFLRGELDIDLFHLYLFSLSTLNSLLNTYFLKYYIFPIEGGGGKESI